MAVVIAIVIGILVTYNEFRKQSDEKLELEREKLEQTKRENRQIAKEFSKEFYQRQLQYYAEVLDATATLATEDRNSED